MPSNDSSPNTFRETAAQITLLLNCFWQADESPETRQAFMAVWIEDFLEFDVAVVSDACREWRRGETRRPSIAELRKLCIDRQSDANWRRDRALPPPKSDLPSWWNDELKRLWPGGPAERQAAIDARKARTAEAETYWAEKSAGSTQWRQMPLDSDERISTTEKERIRRDEIRHEISEQAETRRRKYEDPAVVRSALEALRRQGYVRDLPPVVGVERDAVE